VEYPRPSHFTLFVALLLLFAGCVDLPEAPSDDLDDLIDARGDGFLDVLPPAGVMFDEGTNVRLRIINEVDATDLTAVARAQGVAEELIALLPLASVMISVDMGLHYAGGLRGTLSYGVMLTPFERKLEFACPQRTEVSLRVDMLLPVGNVGPLFANTTTLTQEAEYDCGQTLEFRAWVDDAGAIHVDQPSAGHAVLP
jgi:hypothetical protein